MKVGAAVIAVIFTLLMGVTKAGWGASTPYGWWFGRSLMIFGVSPESLANFTNFPEKLYTMPFFYSTNQCSKCWNHIRNDNLFTFSWNI